MKYRNTVSLDPARLSFGLATPAFIAHQGKTTCFSEVWMSGRDVVSQRFHAALIKSLQIRFGKILSAQRFSDLFNLNARGSSTISRETARLWIRGNAMPDYGHLAVLVQWLAIHPEDFLGNENALRADTSGKNRISMPTGDKQYANRDLLALWDNIDTDTQKTILIVAKALSAEKRADAMKAVDAGQGKKLYRRNHLAN